MRGRGRKARVRRERGRFRVLLGVAGKTAMVWLLVSALVSVVGLDGRDGEKEGWRAWLA